MHKTVKVVCQNNDAADTRCMRDDGGDPKEEVDMDIDEEEGDEDEDEDEGMGIDEDVGMDCDDG